MLKYFWYCFTIRIGGFTLLTNANITIKPYNPNDRCETPILNFVLFISENLPSVDSVLAITYADQGSNKTITFTKKLRLMKSSGFTVEWNSKDS